MKTRSFSLCIGLLLLGILCGGCRQQVFVSGSMAPTIAAGEKVTVNYTAYSLSSPKRWDVVAFKPPKNTSQIWLMRVVALPGESVGLTTNGLAINEQPLALPLNLTNVTYVSLEQPGRPSPLSYPFLVPKDSFFVLGESSGSANDSRFWGALPCTNIVGKVNGK